MIKISYILLNNNLSNLYINTGYYAHKVAEEMKSKSYPNVEVKEITVDLTREQLLEFLNKHQIE